MNPYQSILDAICAAHPELMAAELSLVPAPNLALGDIALRTFESAKRLKMPPPQLAARLAAETKYGPEVREVSAAGPYVNFRLDRGVIGHRIVSQILTEGDHFGSNDSGKGKTALVEHTSINPNASPHVGRARNAMIGDSLVRLLRFEGYDVEVHYYVNDMGRQIALLVLACEDPDALTFDQILQVYTEANERAERDPEFAAQGYELLAKMEQGDPETKRRFDRITGLCFKGQLSVLARLNIAYDHYDHESDYVNDPRLDTVLEALRAKESVFTDEDQRLVADLSKLGHPHEEGRYFVLMRSNGSSMYGYRDLAYTIAKGERASDINLMVLGEDHKLYAQQIALILQTAGKTPPEVIYYAYILLKEGKMSTRQGKVVLLSEFLDEATRLAAERVEEQCKDLAPEERKAIAKNVAVAAVRFAILRVGPNKNVIFDWDASLSFTGDTGPYVQYSCARINSILRKISAPLKEPALPFPTDTDAEWALLAKLATFPDTVAGAVQSRNCAPVAQYALDTARLFTTFYHECPVLKADSEEQRVARAHLCKATHQILCNAMQLLGINTPERM